jgi:hypothetical protein
MDYLPQPINYQNWQQDPEEAAQRTFRFEMRYGGEQPTKGVHRKKGIPLNPSKIFEI